MRMENLLAAVLTAKTYAHMSGTCSYELMTTLI
jgi:hypothetical protein